MSRFSSRSTLAFALMALLYAGDGRAVSAPASHTPCPDDGDVVAVLTDRRELWLCQQGAPVAKFQVALGRGGVEKRREGDGRTPVGTYTLGMPRESVHFGVFIPIDYPTREQAAHGFTGSKVGIHGPPRGMTKAEYPLTSVDWTKGCIAIAEDDDIEFIAEFVRLFQPVVVIR